MTALLEPQTDLACPECGFEAKVRYKDGSLGCFNCYLKAAREAREKYDDVEHDQELRRQAWGRGQHTRYHVNRGIVKIACRYCNPED